MKLEKQVVSLELSKKLKEAGYPREGLFWWIYQYSKEEQFKNTWYLFYKDALSPPEMTNERIRKELYIIAPTVAELGEALPRNYFSCKLDKGWLVFTSKEFDYMDMPEFKDKNEANARAKCWLYLKKEKLC